MRGSLILPTHLLFLVFFISLWKSRFPFVTSLLPSEGLLTVLWCRSAITDSQLTVFILLWRLFYLDTFKGFFSPPQHFKDAHPLFSGFHSFWWKVCGNSYMYFLFFFLLLSLKIFLCSIGFDSLIMGCSGELLKSVGQIWNVFSHYLIFFPLSSFFWDDIYIWPPYIIP